MNEIKSFVGIDTPPPAGAYNVAVAANGFIFLAGQTPREADGTRRGDLPFEAQADLALSNLAAAARSAGSSLARAVNVTVYLSDIQDAREFDAVYRRYFSEPYPARAVVAAGLNQCAVEVMAILVGGG